MRTIEQIKADLIANTRALVRPQTDEARAGLAQARQSLVAELAAAQQAQNQSDQQTQEVSG